MIQKRKSLILLLIWSIVAIHCQSWNWGLYNDCKQSSHQVNGQSGVLAVFGFDISTWTAGNTDLAKTAERLMMEASDQAIQWSETHLFIQIGAGESLSSQVTVSKDEDPPSKCSHATRVMIVLAGSSRYDRSLLSAAKKLAQLGACSYEVYIAVSRPETYISPTSNVRLVSGGAITLETIGKHHQLNLDPIITDDAIEQRLELQVGTWCTIRALNASLRNLQRKGLLPHVALVGSKNYGALVALRRYVPAHKILVNHASIIGGFSVQTAKLYPLRFPMHGELSGSAFGIAVAQPLFRIMAVLARRTRRQYVNAALDQAGLTAIRSFWELYQGSSFALSTTFGIEYQQHFDSFDLNASIYMIGPLVHWDDIGDYRNVETAEFKKDERSIFIWLESELPIPASVFHAVLGAVCSYSDEEMLSTRITWMLTSRSIEVASSVLALGKSPWNDLDKKQSIECTMPDMKTRSVNTTFRIVDSADSLQNLTAEVLADRFRKGERRWFVSTCSLDSVHVALYYKMPLLCIPVESEQTDITNRLLDSLAAERVFVDQADSAQVHQGLRNLELDSRFQESVNRVSLTLRSAPGLQFIRHWIDTTQQDETLIPLGDQGFHRFAGLDSGYVDQFEQTSKVSELIDYQVRQQLHGIDQGHLWLLSFFLGLLGPCFAVMTAFKVYYRLARDALAFFKGNAPAQLDRQLAGQGPNTAPLPTATISKPKRRTASSTSAKSSKKDS